jgi:hypothetical protein
MQYLFIKDGAWKYAETFFNKAMSQMRIRHPWKSPLRKDSEAAVAHLLGEAPTKEPI